LPTVIRENRFHPNMKKPEIPRRYRRVNFTRKS
jgi:hypothetical protein